MPWEDLDALRRLHTIYADSADKIVKTSDGRTGDAHEFHMEAAALQVTVDSATATVAIWATEAALPYGSYDPSIGCPTRNFRLEMSRVSAELLRDALTRELGMRNEDSE